MPVRNPVQIVDEDLNALRALRKIAQSPAALQTMKRIFSEYFAANGNGSKERTLGPGEIVTPSRRGAIWDTGIRKEVEKVLPNLRERDFDYTHVDESLRYSGYHIAAKNPRNAIGAVLRQLVHEGKLRIIKKGAAGKPSTYKVL